MPTREQDDFLRDLGIDPAAYATPGSEGQEGAALAPKDLHKLADLWAATEKHVQEKVHAVRDGLMKLYDGDDAASNAEKEFQAHVDAMFTTFDGQLAQDVAKAAKATSDAELNAVKVELKSAIDGLLQFVATDKAVHIMDSNPFVEVDIAAACTTALAQMKQALA